MKNLIDEIGRHKSGVAVTIFTPVGRAYRKFCREFGQPLCEREWFAFVRSNAEQLSREVLLRSIRERLKIREHLQTEVQELQEDQELGLGEAD